MKKNKFGGMLALTAVGLMLGGIIFVMPAVDAQSIGFDRPFGLPIGFNVSQIQDSNSSLAINGNVSVYDLSGYVYPEEKNSTCLAFNETVTLGGSQIARIRSNFTVLGYTNYDVIEAWEDIKSHFWWGDLHEFVENKLNGLEEYVEHMVNRVIDIIFSIF